MIKRILVCCLLICLPVSSGLGQVDKIIEIVKAQSIDKTLAKQFPQEKSFQGYSATFSSPKIVIDVLDQSIKLAMTVSAEQAQQVFVAKLLFTGTMRYHDYPEAYLFEDLRLDRFSIEQDTYNDSSALIKAIKQSLINDFRDIIMLELGPFKQLNSTRAADQIEISKQQLLLIWHK